MRNRILIAASALVASGLATVPVAVQAMATPSPRACEHLPVTGVDYVLPNGQRSASPVVGAAKAYKFGTLVGLEQVIAPEGFVPASASDQTLAAWGFTPRPRDGDPVALARWSQRHSSPLAPTAAGLCVTPNIHNTTAYSANWSGVYARHPSGVGGVSGGFRIPTYSTGCGSTAAVGMWTGLGGYNSPKLVQSGFASFGTDNTTAAFFEAINQSGFDTGAIWVENFNAATGAIAYADTSYWASEGKFNMNVTSGDQNANLQFSSINGNAASTFYDGTTADFIVERPLVSGVGYTPLKNFGHVDVLDMWTLDPTVPGSVNPTFLRMTSTGQSGGTSLARNDVGFSSSTSFTDNWKACS